MNVIIIRYSEIGLKGKNKKDFEKKLIENIRIYLKKNGVDFERIHKIFSRIIIYTDKKPKLNAIPGISSYSYAKATGWETDSIKNEVNKIIKYYDKKNTFRIRTQRSDKTFLKSSMELDKEIGAFVVKKTGAKVKLKKPQKEIGIEILPKTIFVFDNKNKGIGGLPIGIEGRVLALIEDKKSIDAAKRVMRRGCDIFPIGFEKKDVSILQAFSPKKLTFNKIKNIKEIEEFAKKTSSKALVVGQTLKNFKEIKTNLLILRPLIAN